MDKVIEAATKLSTAIEELPEVQEYLRLKSLLEQNEELKEMRTNIARLTNEGKLEERDNLIKIYNSNPLVSNFEISRKEVEQILLQVKNILD